MQPALKAPKKAHFSTEPRPPHPTSCCNWLPLWSRAPLNESSKNGENQRKKTVGPPVLPSSFYESGKNIENQRKKTVGPNNIIQGNQLSTCMQPKMERRPGVPAADPRRAGARWKSEIKKQPEKGQPENHQLNRCARRRSCPPTKRRRKEAREKEAAPQMQCSPNPTPQKLGRDVQGRTGTHDSRAKTHFTARAFEASVHQ